MADRWPRCIAAAHRPGRLLAPHRRVPPGVALITVVVSSRLVAEPGGELGQADAAGQGGGERGGLAAVQPLQPDLGGLGGGLGVGGRAGQQPGVGDGDRHIEAEEGDAGAAGFLVGGLPGAGVVVGVAGGQVAAGAAGVLAAEVSGADLAVEGRGGGGQRPVLPGDPRRRMRRMAGRPRSPGAGWPLPP
jgi:hypothetical protein